MTPCAELEVAGFSSTDILVLAAPGGRAQVATPVSGGTGTLEMIDVSILDDGIGVVDPMDNIQGISCGPTFEIRNRSRVLVSDNNVHPRDEGTEFIEVKVLDESLHISSKWRSAC